MGVFKIGEAVCNNCVHWRCHSERKFSGNPPREVYTTSNCDKCSLTNRNTLSSNTCGMFRHIGGISTTYRPSVSVDQPNLGESFLSAVMGFVRDSQAIDAVAELMNRHFRDDEECVERRKAESARQILIRHGMRRDASPSDMQDEFTAHPDRYMDKPKVSVSVILMKSDDAEGRNSVLEALKTDDFASVARRYSADTLHAKDGGLWKDVDANEVFRPEIRDAIASLAKGETSQWIDLEGWSFLLRKEDETPAKVRSFAEAYDDIEANVRDARRKALYDRWIEILRSETYIKTY